ncbi:MAG: hypothetical protein O2895_06315, partial [Chloroflexi bacterium]|nr:hypothetical protein [Chloroflexota bacterium]
MTDISGAWALVLLALRIAVVALLYLFLVSAFRALRAELRGGVSMAERSGIAGEAVSDAPRVPAVPADGRPWDDEGLRDTFEPHDPTVASRTAGRAA